MGIIILHSQFSILNYYKPQTLAAKTPLYGAFPTINPPLPTDFTPCAWRFMDKFAAGNGENRNHWKTGINLNIKNKQHEANQINHARGGSAGIAGRTGNQGAHHRRLYDGHLRREHHRDEGLGTDVPAVFHRRTDSKQPREIRRKQQEFLRGSRLLAVGEDANRTGRLRPYTVRTQRREERRHGRRRAESLLREHWRPVPTIAALRRAALTRSICANM